MKLQGISLTAEFEFTREYSRLRNDDDFYKIICAMFGFEDIL